MSVKLRYLLLFCSLFAFGVLEQANAQTRTQLEAERKKIKREIAKVNRLLFDVQKKEKNALEDLSDLRQKITLRSEFIASIQKESQLLSAEIASNQTAIDSLTGLLHTLKASYADMIFKSYTSRSQQSKLMFLLSSENFTQAYKRMQYMGQYARYRKRQGLEIDRQKETIQQLRDSLLYKKQVKDTLILVEKQQKEQIESEQKDQESLVSQIKKKERSYIRQIRKKQEEDRKLAAKIDKIIKEAIARSNRNKKTKSSGFALTPEAKALAIRFEQNKGKLPWPVRSGLIVRRYGKQPHPTLRGIPIISTGIHITTQKGSNAKSVFKGTVLAVQVLSGGKKAVLIQHGNYITTYKNIESLFVGVGDEVQTGQEIGSIFTNKVTGKTTLIFVVHKETQRQNPSLWLLPQRRT